MKYKIINNRNAEILKNRIANIISETKQHLGNKDLPDITIKIVKYDRRTTNNVATAWVAGFGIGLNTLQDKLAHYKANGVTITFGIELYYDTTTPENDWYNSYVIPHIVRHELAHVWFDADHNEDCQLMLENTDIESGYFMENEEIAILKQLQAKTIPIRSIAIS